MATASPQLPNSGENKLGQFLLGMVMLAGTAVVLYLGFDFFRLNSGQEGNIPQWLVVILAIIWGVGGVAMLFFVFNYIVETFNNAMKRLILPYVFVLPAVALLFYYLALPTFRTLWLSFLDRDGSEFVGLQNYGEVLTSPEFLTVFRNNFLWVAIGATLSVIFGLVIAVLADRSRYEKIIKSIIFLPMAISFVGAGVIWNFIYEIRDVSSNQIGLLNAIVVAFGGTPKAWTTQIWIRELETAAGMEPGSALFAWANNLFLIVILVWLQTGFAMVLFSAALKGIPSELIEASRVDGANEYQIFFRIMIPYITGTILTVSTTIMIFTLKIFDVVWVMTGGNHDTEVIATQFFRESFVLRNSGYGSTIAILLLVAVIPVMIYNLRQFSNNEAF